MSRDIHEAFGLSYASYLVVPRLVLQSMPVDWQHRFVALLDELHETFDGWEPPAGYEVRARAKGGRFHPDPLSDYRRGSCGHLRRAEPPHA